MAALKWQGGTLTLPTGQVEDEHVSNSTEIDADKLQHLHKAGTNFDLAVGGTPATREETVFVASAAGAVRGFHATLTDTGTTTAIAFDLKKNGTTVLSGTVDFTHGDSDREVKSGTVTGVAFAAGDHFTIAMTVTSSTGALGPFAWAEFDESPA